MDAREFWRWIDESLAASGGETDRQIGILHQRLAAAGRSTVIAFNDRLCEALREARHWNIQVAAWAVGCGDSDDGFLDFRAWLVTRGERIFRATIADPDTLADVPVGGDPLEEWTCEDLMWQPEFVLGEDAGLSLAISRDPADRAELAGEPCAEFPSAIRARAPRLWARFEEARAEDESDVSKWKEWIRTDETELQKHGARMWTLLGAAAGAFGYAVATWSIHGSTFLALALAAGTTALALGIRELRRAWSAVSRIAVAKSILKRFYGVVD